jgi:hypothetical protein
VRDRIWSETWDTIKRHIRAKEKLLLPEGDWPISDDLNVGFYNEEIEIGDSTLFLLHKGRMGCINKKILGHVFRRWNIILANDVFVGFTKKPINIPFVNTLILPRHARPVKNHLMARKKKRVSETAFFVHLPKAAGTTAWEAISKHVPSKVYYGTYPAFLANPPGRNEYDLVGGHIPLSIAAHHMGIEDQLICLVREPVSRFRSAFLHSRRPHEDPATFSPVMRAMREMPLKDFLKRPDARMEVCQQFLMLGFGFDREYDSARDDLMFQGIAEYVRNPQHVFMTAEAVETFADHAATLLKAPPLPRKVEARNVSDKQSQKSDMEEFNDCIDEIKSLNRAEAAVYNLVRTQERKYR